MTERDRAMACCPALQMQRAPEELWQSG
jgi:hypothetical protein